MRIIKTVLLAFCISLICSCGDDDDSTKHRKAILVWQGEYYDNGGGFVVIIDSKEYKPSNEEVIAEKFKRNGMIKVDLELIFTHQMVEFNCGMNSPVEELEGIDIVSVKEK